MTEQTAFALGASVVGFVSAIFFCVGNALNSVEKITLQSTMFWDASEPIARALSSQRAQYITGGLLLVISFSLQVFASVTSSTNPATLPLLLHTWPYLVFAIFVPTSFVSWIFCLKLEQNTISKVLQEHKIFLEKKK
jgi:hypothetical protein